LNYFILLTVPFLLASATVHADSENSHRIVGVGIIDSTGASIGLKFTPPAEEGWTTERSGLAVSLKKNTNSSSDNREIEAYLIRLDSPISPISGYVETIRRNLEEAYANNKKIKINALEVIEDPKDSRCARGHLLLETIQPDQVVEERKWSEQYFLSCGLLKRKGLGFELRYYHRYLDSRKDKQFVEDARRVFESMIIDDN
jgi:hypothetical protein